MSLRLTCYNLSLLPKPNFKSIFKQRLLSFLDTEKEAEDFCQNLYKSKAMVSGSFILDCLYGTNYHDDIDIYDQADPNKIYMERSNFKFGDNYLKFNQYLYNQKFKNFTHDNDSDETYIIRSYIPNKIYSQINNDKTIDMYIKYEEYLKYKNKIQVIPIALSKGSWKFILASFDLDICKNGFDGQNLYIRSWNKLINRKDYIKPNTKVLIHTYFHRYCAEEIDEKITKERLEKYKSRGFNIKKHPKYNEIKNEISDILNNDILNYTKDTIKYIEDGLIDLDKYYLE